MDAVFWDARDDGLTAIDGPQPLNACHERFVCVFFEREIHTVFITSWLDDICDSLEIVSIFGCCNEFDIFGTNTERDLRRVL